MHERAGCRQVSADVIVSSALKISSQQPATRRLPPMPLCSAHSVSHVRYNSVIMIEMYVNLSRGVNGHSVEISAHHTRLPRILFSICRVNETGSSRSQEGTLSYPEACHGCFEHLLYSDKSIIKHVVVSDFSPMCVVAWPSPLRGSPLRQRFYFEVRSRRF